MASRVFLSIVIPAYNESRRLESTLRRIVSHCSLIGQPFEIIVVDDGSTDDTAQMVESAKREIGSLRLVSYRPNRGKGYAVRMGIQESKGQYILFSDADLSTPIEEMDRFLPLLQNGTPVVIGTRKHKEAEIMKHQSLLRESMGKVFTGISNLILGLNVSDFTCGFKGFHQVVAKEIFARQQIERWAFDSEILFLARRYGYVIAEVPVRWMNSPETKVRLLRDTVTSFLALFRIRWNALKGKYDTGL